MQDKDAEWFLDAGSIDATKLKMNSIYSGLHYETGWGFKSLHKSFHFMKLPLCSSTIALFGKSSPQALYSSRVGIQTIGYS